jgi:hypothetical protein
MDYRALAETLTHLIDTDEGRYFVKKEAVDTCRQNGIVIDTDEEEDFLWNLKMLIYQGWHTEQPRIRPVDLEDFLVAWQSAQALSTADSADTT